MVPEWVGPLLESLLSEPNGPLRVLEYCKGHGDFEVFLLQPNSLT